MVVITRTQSRKQLEEEIVRREQEFLSGVEPKQIAGITHAQAGTSNQDTQTVRGTPATLTQDQRCALRKEMGNIHDQSTKSKALGDTLELSELQQQLEMDSSLAKVREAAEDWDYNYFKRDKLLYRRWVPPGRG